MGRIYLLCTWVCLPRVQPLVLTVHSWPCPDTGATDTGAADTGAADDIDDDDTFSDDDNQHADNAGWRVHVFLCTELRQLVVQMFMVLLQRVLAMHSNSHHNCTIASGVPALVCDHVKALE